MEECGTVLVEQWNSDSGTVMVEVEWNSECATVEQCWWNR